MTDWVFWVATGISVLGTLCSVASYQCKKNEQLIVWQLTGAVLWTTHFIMLGAWSAALINGVAIARAYVARSLYQRGYIARAWPILITAGMIVAGAVGAVVGWGGSSWMAWVPLWLGRTVLILMIVANVLCTLAMWTRNGTVIRWTQLLAGSPVWLSSNLINYSIFGVATEVFTMVSVIVSLIRYRRR